MGFDLDLGGFNTVYVGETMLEDKEAMDFAVDKIVRGTFRNCGQERSSVQHILVHKSL